MAHEKKPGFFKRLTDVLFEEMPGPVIVIRSKPAPPHLNSLSPGEPSPGLDAAFYSDESAKHAQNQASTDAVAAGWDDTHFAPAAKTGGVRDAILSQVAFAARLNEVVQKGQKSSAGKLQLVNLDEIKRDAGNRWEQIAQKAQIIAEQVIRHRLAPSDVLAPYEESGFVILFAELSEEQARLKAAAIAREVRQRLLGELGVKDDGWVKAFVTDAASLQKNTGDLPPEEAALAWGRAFEGKEDCAPPISNLNAIDSDVQTRLGEVGVSYWPTLMVPKNIVGIYATHMIRLDALNRILSGPNAYPHGDTAVAFEMDRAAVKRAIEQAYAAIKRGQRPGLIHVRLHVSSLLSHSSGLIVDMFRALQPEFRRLFIIGINAQAHGTPLAKILGTVSVVQPFCRTVTVQVPTDFLDFERLARAKVSAAGIDLEEAEMGEVTPERLTREILPFSKATAKVGLHSYLYGIKQREMAKAARDAGFTYLNGPAITPTVGQPVTGQSVCPS